MTLHFRSVKAPAGLARHRPALTQPLSLDDALRALKSICAASREPTGGRPYDTPISESAEHGLVSALRSALNHAKVDVHDVRMALPDLPQHAAAAARSRGNASPSEAASRARRALRLLTGIEPASTKLDAPHLFISAGFVELQTFAARRQDRTKLVILARTCAAMGNYDAPRVMPTVEELSAFASSDTSPYQANTVRNAVSTYRRVRSIAVRTEPERADRFADQIRRPNARSRVMRALSPLVAATDDSTSPLVAVSTALRNTFPQIATEIDLYLRGPDAARASHSWHTTIRTAVLRLVSLLDAEYRGGACAATLPAPTEIRLWHLYACDVPLQEDGATHADAAFFAAVGSLSGKRGLLIQRLLLNDAPEARRESSIGGTDAMNESWMPEVCVRNECAIWSLVTSLYLPALAAGDWAAQQTRRGVVADWLHASKAGVEVRAGREIDKIWLVTHLSLPLLMCVGLPWMAQRVRVLRAEWLRVQIAGAPEHVRDRTFRRYAFALHDYCAVALVADDGMRRKNYTNSQHGQHVLTTYAEERLIAVELRFGVDRRNDPACLKIIDRRRRKRSGGQKVQDHVHVLSPAAVDFELLDWWFREVSPGFSYQRPTLSDVQFAPSALFGRYLFPSAPRTHRRRRTGAEFAERVHAALYDVIRLLHGDAVPASRAGLTPARAKACTLHRIRLLLTTYWGGIRNDWPYAEHLTTDRESTLREHYNASMSSPMMDKLQGRADDWRHPRYFDDLMDAIRARQAVSVADDPRVRRILAERAGGAADTSLVPAPRRWRARRPRRAV